MEEEVLLNSSFGDSLSPGDDGCEVTGSGLAISKLSRESLGNSNELFSSIRPVLGLDISNDLGKVSFERGSLVSALLNFGEVVLDNKTLKESSYESGDSSRGDRREGSRFGRLSVEIDSHLDVTESVSLSLDVFVV
jgi:hypothetical protein